MSKHPVLVGGKVSKEWDGVMVPIGTSDCHDCGAREVLFRFEDFEDSSKCAKCWDKEVDRG